MLVMKYVPLMTPRQKKLFFFL